MPVATPSFETSELLDHHPSFALDLSTFPALDSVELDFLRRGYGYSAAPSTSSPTSDTLERSTADLYLGAGLRGRFDDFNTPETLSREETPDMILGATISSIGSSQTMYLGTFEDKTDAKVSIPVPEGRAVELNVRATAAPGTGESFVYDIIRNGVVSGLSITVSGTSQDGSTSTDPVTCSTGDRLSLRLQTSSGAATAHHRYSLRYVLT